MSIHMTAEDHNNQGGGPTSATAPAAGEESDGQFLSNKRRRRGSQDTASSVSTPRGTASSSGGGGGGDGGGGGSVTRARKKSKQQDGRWSKRFTWPEDLHRDFVSAIFDVGLKQSSPSTILEHMPKHEQITTERIKSHLQKYRLHRAKSKKEFISSYEASMRTLQNRGGTTAATTGSLNTSGPMTGGEVAAHLTYVISSSTNGGGMDVEDGQQDSQSMQQQQQQSSSAAVVSNISVNPTKSSDWEDTSPNGTASPHSQQQQQQQQPSPPVQSDSLVLPELTEKEKQSPIGISMGYLMGLFFSLRQQLMIQRSMEQERNDHSAAVQGQHGNSSYGPGNNRADYPAEGGVPHQQQPMPSMRTNIEENSIMKREMQNQMALQNKMRSLKEQELAKYKNVAHTAPGATSTSRSSRAPQFSYTFSESSAGEHPSSSNKDDPHHASAEGARSQGAGETAGHDVPEGGHERPRGLSFGNSDDFWNTDIVDDQLFEFLMNG
jgi:SHAQKYF class myb-like DNA-binding protein